MGKKTLLGWSNEHQDAQRDAHELELGACLREWERYKPFLFSFYTHSCRQELVFFFSFHEKQETSFNGKLQALMESLASSSPLMRS